MLHVLLDGERGSRLEDTRTVDRLLLRALKHAGSAMQKPGIPANIRVDGLRLDERDREHIRRRLGEKLGRHANSVERVTVQLRDVNGPHGGVDVQCRIKVVLNGLPSVVVEQRATAFRLAFIEGAGRRRANCATCIAAQTHAPRSRRPLACVNFGTAQDHVRSVTTPFAK